MGPNPCGICCCSVESAKDFVAFYSIIAYGFQGLIMARSLLQMGISGRNYAVLFLSNNTIDLTDPLDFAIPPFIDPTEMSVVEYGVSVSLSIVMFALIVAGLITSGLLVLGKRTDRDNNLKKCKAWLIVETIFQILRVAAIFGIFIYSEFEPNQQALLIICLIIFNSYFMSVIFAYMRKIELGDFDTDSELEEEIRNSLYGEVYRD